MLVKAARDAEARRVACAWLLGPMYPRRQAELTASTERWACAGYGLEGRTEHAVYEGRA